MSLPEILSPAGGAEQLEAAVRSGADAVYFGAVNFNARRNAKNFTEEEFASAVKYCHARGVKAYITLNTLIKDSETDGLLDEIRLIANSGADAVIVQDLAVAEFVKKICPAMPLHASTQMTVHNAGGVKMCEELGFSRVVPARELSLAEIETLAACSPLETEVFVHGALCMSVSGACYLSSLLGGRSGNRGLCAQPCRLGFTSRGRQYALSLRDMSYIPRIGELRKAGVDSLKIEGRMKRPEYVAATADACRKALNGEKADMDTLGSVFSRSGFTDGYLTAKRDLSMFGYRTKDNVTAASGILGKLPELYRKERQSVPVKMALSLRENENMTLTVSDSDGRSFTAEGGKADRAEGLPLDEAYAARALSKTGGTPFYAAEITAENPCGLMCAPSALNALRRDALAGLYAMRENSVRYELTDYAPSRPVPHRAEKRGLRVRYENYGQITESCADAVILPLDEILARQEIPRGVTKLIAEIPPLVFAEDEEQTVGKLRELKKLGVNDVQADNIGMIYHAKKLGFTIHGGFGLNILNSYALNEYGKLGLADATVSFELSENDIRKLGGELPRGVVVYGYLPLMKFRSCPARTLKNGKTVCSCGGEPSVTDRYSTVFRLICRGRKYSELLNSVPLCVTDKNFENTDFSLLYFTTESRETCAEVIRKYEKGESISGSRTNGLYFRELL